MAWWTWLMRSSPWTKARQAGWQRWRARRIMTGAGGNTTNRARYCGRQQRAPDPSPIALMVRTSETQRRRIMQTIPDCLDISQPDWWQRELEDAQALLEAREWSAEEQATAALHAQEQAMRQLPEAPASVNCYLMVAGRKVQLTLRDTQE